MATVRQMLNRVLVNLSEEEIGASVTELSDAYQKTVLNFINHVKAEMEDAHNWRIQQSTETVAVPASTGDVAIANTNERSRLVRIHDSRRPEVIPMVFNKTDANNPIRMTELDLNELLRRRATQVNTEPSSQRSWAFAIDQDADGLRLYVWPSSTQVQSIDVRLVIPQDRLEADSLDTVIEVPETPLELGATNYGLLERGEELGVNSLFSQDNYKRSVDSAIGRDEAEQGSSNDELVSV